MTERDVDVDDTQVRPASETAPAPGTAETAAPSPAPSEPVAAPALDPAAATPDLDASAAGESSGGTADERPELFVAGAFAGGLALAMLLKWLGPDE
jgi:hypothetical protein